MDKLTQDDFRKAYEAINNNEGTTWAKTLYTFEDGTDLCFVAAMMDFDGTDEYEPYAKLACIPYNSGMNDYEWDYVMPYKEGSGDVWDTETSFGPNEDPEWFNEQAEEIIQAVENGEYITSGCHSKKKKGKKVVKSGNLPMRDREANYNFEQQQKEWYSKPGTERAKAHHNDKVNNKIDMVIPTACDQEMWVQMPDGENELEYNMHFNPEYGLELGIRDFYNRITHESSEVTDGTTPDGEDNYHQMHTLFANMLEKKRYNGQPIELSLEGDEIWIKEPFLDVDAWSDNEIRDYIMFFHKAIAEIAPKVYNALKHRMSLMQSRKPVKSAMPGREKSIRAIMDEYGCSWEEAEEIMNEQIGSSKKPVKSAMQISEIHNNTPNLYVRIVYCDCDYFSEYSYEQTDEPLPLNEFKQMCKDFAETSNGEYMIQHDNDYQPAEYVVDFANWEAENEDEQILGTIKFELLIDAGDELINYLEDDRYM